MIFILRVMPGFNVNADARRPAHSYIKPMTQTPVRDNTALQRFELESGGATAVAYYRRSPSLITFTHTEVPRQMRERGIGSQLLQGALQAVRAEGLKVLPRCSFVAHYLSKHPEFQDLLA
jgi:predicted GNAT family acetyltransferase